MQSFIELQTWPILLKASGQAAVLIMLVLTAQRTLGQRLGPRWRHALWLLVVLRLVLPVTIPSSVSLFNVLPFSKTSAAVVSLRTTSGTQYSVDAPTAASPERSVQEKAVTPTAGPTEQGMSFSFLTWWPLVWLAGAVVMALCLMTNHYRIHRGVARRRPLIDAAVMNFLEDCKQRMGVRTPITLVETPAVDGPTLFGFVRPRLLLPPGFTSRFSHAELRFVFLHELGHVKRHDIPLGWLMAMLQILHWFNPLVWLAFWRMRVDRELACDALALSYAEDHDNTAYGHTIVKLLESFGNSFRAPSLAGIIEDKQQMKERIVMIAQFQKSNRGFVLAGVLCLGLGLLTLTDAQSASDNSDSPSAKSQSPPHVVSTSPKIGVTDVNPSLKEITVTFDREMGGGMSWTGSGPNFPKIKDGAKAHWRSDKRTCVLPVTLAAGHYYRVGINSTSYQNFRGADGTPANPSVISFRTRGGGDVATLETTAPQIVSLDPPNGASGVSPTVTELRVTFNVAMGGGMSWCGGGPHFPAMAEGKKAHWTEDGKTCVLPVELKPSSEYELGLNSPSFNNFQSAAGVPLAPVHYTFKTSDKQ